jgi:phosphoribosylaminoimidazole-succinocarboxamide synthase
MGSVKDLYVLKKPDINSEGEGRFIFSDRYSVFDWGEMPDHIENKGASLCILSSYFFNLLEKNNIKTHFIGLVENEKIKKYEEISEPTNIMQVKMVRVIKPVYNKERNIYDYSAYKYETKNYLIPLEIIYRNKLTEGSSVFKRLKSGSITYKDLGLDHEPKIGEVLNPPLLDVSTKLEHFDRYLSWEEAKHISNLTDKKLDQLKNLILKINKIITEECKKADIENVDGKFEFAFDRNGEIMVVDVLGTPDECRFLYNDFHISKEFARRWYRKTKWYEEVEKAKKEYGDDWKKNVKIQPDKLPEKMKNLISQMYMSVTNAITGKKFFNVPEIKIIIDELKKYDI